MSFEARKMLGFFFGDDMHFFTKDLWRARAEEFRKEQALGRSSTALFVKALKRSWYYPAVVRFDDAARAVNLVCDPAWLEVLAIVGRTPPPEDGDTIIIIDDTDPDSLSLQDQQEEAAKELLELVARGPKRARLEPHQNEASRSSPRENVLKHLRGGSRLSLCQTKEWRSRR